MPRIVMIVSNPCLTDARVIKMAESVANEGHEVHVFATEKTGVSHAQKVNNVYYHRLRWNLSETLRNNSWLIKKCYSIHPLLGKLVRGNLSYYMKFRTFADIFAPHIAKLKPDLIHAHDLITLPTAHRAAAVCGAKVVYDAHELEIHRNPPLPFFRKRYIAYVEHKLGSKADGVIMAGREAAKVLSKHLGRDDLVIAMNSPIIEPSSNTIRGDLKLSESDPLCVYVGKIAMGRGIQDVLEILPQVPSLNFVAVGPFDTPTLKIVLNKANQLGVSDRFFVLPPVPFKEVVSYIKGADVGILSVEPVTLSYRLCMPNKLFEMSFADIPIITNELEDASAVVRELQNGEIINFESKPAIGYMIERVIKEKENYKLTHEAKQILEEKFSWKTQMDGVLAMYDRILHEK